MNDNEAKKKIMAEMMADFIEIVDSPEGISIICDHLIRKGWRKINK